MRDYILKQMIKVNCETGYWRYFQKQFYACNIKLKQAKPETSSVDFVKKEKIQILLVYSNLRHSSICRIIVEVVNRLRWIVIVSLHLFANMPWQMASANVWRLLNEQINTKNPRLLNWAMKFEVFFTKNALS